MDVSRIVAEIDAQLGKLQEARTILVGLGSAPELVQDKPRRGRPKGSVNAPKTGAAAKVVKRKRNLSPEGRKRIADAMKRRWAERRSGSGTAKKDTPKK